MSLSELSNHSEITEDIVGKVATSCSWMKALPAPTKSFLASVLKLGATCGIGLCGLLKVGSIYAGGKRSSHPHCFNQ